MVKCAVRYVRTVYKHKRLLRVSVGITGTLEQRLEQLDEAIRETLR